MLCKDCEYWYGATNLSYTGCQLGMINIEITRFYLEDKLVEKEIGLSRCCTLFKPKRKEEIEINN